MSSSTTKKRERKKKWILLIYIYIVINMRAYIHIESIECEKTIHVYIQRSDEEKERGVSAILLYTQSHFYH
jgi:hypothetical protein